MAARDVHQTLRVLDNIDESFKVQNPRQWSLNVLTFSIFREKARVWSVLTVLS